MTKSQPIFLFTRKFRTSIASGLVVRLLKARRKSYGDVRKIWSIHSKYLVDIKKFVDHTRLPQKIAVLMWMDFRRVHKFSRPCCIFSEAKNSCERKGEIICYSKFLLFLWDISESNIRGKLKVSRDFCHASWKVNKEPENEWPWRFIFFVEPIGAGKCETKAKFNCCDLRFLLMDRLDGL